MLDTNALIHLARGNEALIARVNSYKKNDIGTSAIVKTEFAIGIFSNGTTKKDKQQLVELFKRFKPAPFTPEDAEVAAHIIVANKLVNEQAIYRDTMIAAQALRLGATVVTNNLTDFYKAARGVPKLKIQDWTLAL